VPKDTWSTVVTYPDRSTAEAMLGLLSSGGVPCHITSDEHLPGLASFFSIVVPSELLHGARWLLEDAKVSESELTFFATQELPDGSTDK
jgi:hypothetical protein